MSSGSYEVKVPGGEEVGLTVASAHMSVVTETCAKEENLGRLTPLFFGSRLSESGLTPISYMLIGARVADIDGADLSRADFRTTIQLRDTPEIEDMLPELITHPADDQLFGDVRVGLVPAECAIDLSSHVTYPAGERVPKRPWLAFVGASFFCALEVAKNYADVSSSQTDYPAMRQPSLGRMVVGNMAA